MRHTQFLNRRNYICINLLPADCTEINWQGSLVTCCDWLFLFRVTYWKYICWIHLRRSTKPKLLLFLISGHADFSVVNCWIMFNLMWPSKSNQKLSQDTSHWRRFLTTAHSEPTALNCTSTWHSPVFHYLIPLLCTNSSQRGRILAKFNL